MALAIQSGMELVDLDQIDIPPEVSTWSPATRRGDQGRAVLLRRAHAHGGPRRPAQPQRPRRPAVHSSEGRRIQPAVRSRGRDPAGAVDTLLRRQERIDLGRRPGADDIVVEEQRQDLPTSSSSRRDANAGPVVKLLNMILLQAIKDRASDIHFEPFEHEFKIRYRVDGVLYEMMPPPLQLARAVISPRQGHGQPRHRRDARCPRTAASSSTSAATPSTCASPRCPRCSARAS